jgi:hypothetical protein
MATIDFNKDALFALNNSLAIFIADQANDRMTVF